MSGLAGIFNLNGTATDSRLLGRMTQAIAHRGPDGIRHVIDGSIGMSHCALATTPESLHERQPLWDQAKLCCLALDGRIDNRDDLTRDLDAAGASLRDGTDAELVLNAYLTWGDDAPRRLIGDFAFVIWDKRRRHLFCARDHLGIKPLYYYTDGNSFLWASELQQLFQHPCVPRLPNEGMIAEYLADAVTSVTETLWTGIMRVAPAHCLTVTRGGIVQKQYWSISDTPQLRYRTDNQYAGHFLHLFTEAVRCRLRSHRPVGVELSGGVDSSSVAGIASTLSPHVETYSLIFPGLSCDETRYIDAVVKHCAIRPSHRLTTAADTGWYAKTAARYQDIPDQPNSFMSYPLRALSRHRGMRAMLTGAGGDDWFTGIPAKPAFIQHIRRMLRPLRRALRPSPPYRWLAPEFMRRTHLLDRVRATVWPGGFLCHALGLEERGSAAHELELRHPFHDRRVIEFSVAVPPDQLFRAETRKLIIRNAMSEIIPELVRTRNDKAEFSHLFDKAFPQLQPYRSEVVINPPLLWPLWWSSALQCWADTVGHNPGEPNESCSTEASSRCDKESLCCAEAHQIG